MFAEATLICEQICKRRARVLSTKSPAPGVMRTVGQQKGYRHLGLLPHSLVKRLLDITDADGRHTSGWWGYTILLSVCLF